MLTRWLIKAAPTPKDPQRRMLLVKGAWSDVHGLVRRLGPVCGRPKKEASDPEFNYSIALHKLDEAALAGVEAALTALAPSGGSGKTPLPAAPAVPTDVTTPTPSTPEPTLPDSPPPPPSSAEPFAGFGGVPPPDQQATTPPLTTEPRAANPFAGFGKTDPALKRVTAHEPLSPQFETLPDLMAAARTPDPVPLGDFPAEPFAGLTLTPTPASLPTPPSPASSISPLEVIAAGAAPTASEAALPRDSARSPLPEPPQPPVEAPKPLPLPTTSMPAPAPRPVNLPAAAAEPLFGALKGIDPELTLDNLVVGSYNRFAHAAAMSLLTSAGGLYNPLVVWGGAGSGKTHMVNALALRLQEQSPHETVWLSSGSALARAAGLAQASGRAAELHEFAAKARALVIDDLHMTGLGEHNAETLAKVVGAMLHAGKQVVVASLYQPRHIAALETALGLKTDKSHVVELKAPNDAAQQAIGAAALSRLGLAPTSEEKDVFSRGLLKDFTALDDHMRRLAGLAALAPAGSPLSQSLRDLFAVDMEAEALTAEKLKASMPKAPPEGKTALALCHPPGGEAHARFILARLGETAKARGWPFPWRVSAKVAYAVDPPHAAPYLLAEECLRAGAGAALVVGPTPGTDLAAQERPFRAAAQRLLAEAGLSCAVVPYARVQDPKQALFGYLDLNSRPGGR
ncbi:MAG: ATP-binding protein [Elusimicrobia bacterium]|nr:ATP-binding protein [Elusimicrobiota bacterium]